MTMHNLVDYFYEKPQTKRLRKFIKYFVEKKRTYA